MSLLEETLRAAVRQGELNHLSITYDPVVGYNAMFRRAGHGASEHFADKDPVKAILGAMLGRKRAETLMARESADPPKPKTFYWWHPDSGSLFTTQDSEPAPKDPLCEELTESEYLALKLKLETPKPKARRNDLEDL